VLKENKALKAKLDEVKPTGEPQVSKPQVVERTQIVQQTKPRANFDY